MSFLISSNPTWWQFLLFGAGLLILFYVPQAVTLYIFLRKFLVLKSNKRLFTIGLALFYMMKSFSVASLTPMYSVIFHFILYSLITILYFRGSLLQKMFFSTFYTVFTVIIELMIWFGLSIDGNQSIVSFVIIVILSNGLCLLMLRLFTGDLHRGSLPNKEWGMLMLVPSSSLGIIMLHLRDVPVLEQNRIEFAHALSLEFLLTLTSLLVINTAVILMYHTLVKRMQSELHNMLLQQQVKEYEQKWQQHNTLAVMQHDMNHMFTLLSSMLDHGQVEQARQSIYTAQYKGKDQLLSSGNIVIDAICNEKLNVAVSHDIVLRPSFQVPQDLSLAGKEVELAVILGNALDNAIEGVMRLPNPCDRGIDLEVVYREGLLVIAVKNPADNVHRDVEFTTFLSSKRKHKEQGIGIESIRHSVEKLQGNVSFSYLDGQFKMIATLPL